LDPSQAERIAPTSKPLPDATEEDWERRNLKRDEQVENMKARQCYDRYAELCPSHERCRTPDPYSKSISKRAWKCALRRWTAAVFAFELTPSPTSPHAENSPDDDDSETYEQPANGCASIAHKREERPLPSVAPHLKRESAVRATVEELLSPWALLHDEPPRIEQVRPTCNPRGFGARFRSERSRSRG